MIEVAGYDLRLHAAMAELANNFPLRGVEVKVTLNSVTTAAVELIDGIDYADVLLIDGDNYQSLAPTDPIATKADALQRQFHQGPCLQAAQDGTPIRCPDLRDDPRWPEFSAAATGLGIVSMMSFQLYRHSGGVGALNLFGAAPCVFSQETQAVGAMLATHAALALTADDTRHQFDSALASRDHIGQAKGILMERFNIDAVQAFELLRKLSQETNTPVRELAERLLQRR